MTEQGIKRERVTWVRWDAAALRDRTSHPYVWTYTDGDGQAHHFDTRLEAVVYAAAYEGTDYAGTVFGVTA